MTAIILDCKEQLAAMEEPQAAQAAQANATNVTKRRSQIRSWLNAKPFQLSRLPSEEREAPSAQTPSDDNVAVANQSVASSSSSSPGDSTDKHPIKSRIFKRRSLAVSPKDAEQAELHEGPSVSLNLIPMRDGHIYHPGGPVVGNICFADCGHDASDVKSVLIRVIGEITYTHYDINESMMKKTVRTSRQRFLALSPLKISHTTEYTWITEDDPKTGKLRTRVPFEARLPERGVSMYDTPRQARNRSVLPPTMHWECSDEDDQKLKKSKVPDGVIHDVVEKIKKFAAADPPKIVCQTRYYVGVQVRWKGQGPFHKTTSLKSDIIVLPKPPLSTSINYALPNRRHVDSTLARALGARYAIEGQELFQDASHHDRDHDQQQTQEQGASSTPSGTVNRRESRRNRAPTIGYLLPRSSPAGRDSQWTKIVLQESERGPQAWQLHHVNIKESSLDIELEAELSMPATVALLLDTSSPFQLAIHGSSKDFALQSVNVKLLRSIVSNTYMGRMELESMQEVVLDGRPVLEVRNLKSVETAVEPPLDEYEDGADEGPFAAFEGHLYVASGWRQSRKEITDRASQTIPLKGGSSDEVSRIQLGALLTTPSFSFRNVALDYALVVEVTLESKGPSRSCVTLRSEPTPIKIASPAGGRVKSPRSENQAARRIVSTYARTLSQARSVSSFARRRGSRQQLRRRERSRTRSGQSGLTLSPRSSEASSLASGATVFDDASQSTPFATPQPRGNEVSFGGGEAQNSPRQGGGGAGFFENYFSNRPLAASLQSMSREELMESSDVAQDLPTMSDTATPPYHSRAPPASRQNADNFLRVPLGARGSQSSQGTSAPPVAPSARAAMNHARPVPSIASMASLRTIDGPAPPYSRPFQDA